MAVLGFQLVSTLIGVSLLTKLSTHFSFASVFVFGGIYRYLPPTDKEILEGAGCVKVKPRAKRNGWAGVGGSGDGSNVFHIPRSTPIKLHKVEVRAQDIAILPFYTDLVWLVDFSVCSLFVLFINDSVSLIRQLSSLSSFGKTTFLSLSMHSFFAPSTINLNLVWSFFIIWFATTSLFSVLRVYVTSGADSKKVGHAESSSSEWPLLMVAGFSSFVIAMLCMSLDVSFLDLRLSSAYGNLTTLSSEATERSTMSWGMFQTCLSIYAAIVGVFFTFPSLQYGRVYVQSLQNPESSWLTRFLFRLNLIAPQLTLLLWVVPLTSRLPTILLQHAGSSLGEAKLVTTWFSFVTFCARAFSFARIRSLRLLFTLLTFILRVAMTKRHMQAFLDTAQTRLSRLNREPGRITNREMQRIVAGIFHCFNFAALQYLAPAMLLIGLAFSYKISTDTDWLPVAPHITPASSSTSLSSVLEALGGQDWDSVFTASWFAALQHTRQSFGELWQSLRCQAGHVCQGVLGFALFWCLTAWQAVAFTGMAYHRFVE